MVLGSKTVSHGSIKHKRDNVITKISVTGLVEEEELCEGRLCILGT